MSTDQLAEIEQKIAHLTKQIKKTGEKISALTSRKYQEEKNLRDAKHAQWMIQQKNFIKAGVSPELGRARMQIFNCMAIAKRKDITVKQKESAEKEIVDLKAALQAKCDHRFVLNYDGYGGSESYDYDDRRRGHRLCVVCAFEEYEQSCGKDDYKILIESGHCLVKRDLREKEEVKKWSVWIPLPEILAVFSQSTNYRNANW